MSPLVPRGGGGAGSEYCVPRSSQRPIVGRSGVCRTRCCGPTHSPATCPASRRRAGHRSEMIHHEGLSLFGSMLRSWRRHCAELSRTRGGDDPPARARHRMDHRGPAHRFPWDDHGWSVRGSRGGWRRRRRDCPGRTCAGYWDRYWDRSAGRRSEPTDSSFAGGQWALDRRLSLHDTVDGFRGRPLVGRWTSGRGRRADGDTGLIGMASSTGRAPQRAGRSRGRGTAAVRHEMRVWPVSLPRENTQVSAASSPTGWPPREACKPKPRADQAEQ
jgi:hypothetical protein